MKNVFDKIPERSAILILGPPLSSKDNILYSLVSKELVHDSSVIFITTDHFPKDIEDILQKYSINPKKYEKSGNLRFIDCYSAQARDTYSHTEAAVITPGPLALNEISVALAEIENFLYRKNKKQFVIFQSLSTLLIYSRPEAIERFVQVIVARTKRVNGTIIFTIEEGMHDEKVVVGFEHLMDGIITLSDKKPLLRT